MNAAIEERGHNDYILKPTFEYRIGPDEHTEAGFPTLRSDNRSQIVNLDDLKELIIFRDFEDNYDYSSERRNIEAEIGKKTPKDFTKDRIGDYSLDISNIISRLPTEQYFYNSEEPASFSGDSRTAVGLSFRINSDTSLKFDYGIFNLRSINWGEEMLDNLEAGIQLRF